MRACLPTGIGENLRGRFMDAVDSTVHGSSSHPERHQGTLEVERGMAKLTGGPGANTAAQPQSRAPTSGTTASSGASPGAPPMATAPQPHPSYPSEQAVSGPADAHGPTSAMDAGFGNAGPEAAVASVQRREESSGGVSSVEQHAKRMPNDRNFGSANETQDGGMTGPVADRYAYSGSPNRLG